MRLKIRRGGVSYIAGGHPLPLPPLFFVLASFHSFILIIIIFTIYFEKNEYTDADAMREERRVVRKEQPSNCLRIREKQREGKKRCAASITEERRCSER